MRNIFTLSLLAACTLAGSAWAQTDPDNTGVNARDRNKDYLTSTDQSNDPADLKITAETRKMVVADSSLSMEAKNAKIITISGIVTLRGPVESKKEKEAIEAHAKMAGAKKVDNLLEVKTP